jgi:purine-nucleoside phosphorylase
MDTRQREIDQAVAAIRSRWSSSAKAGVILGTGMSQIADQIDAEAVIPYGEIPNFPTSTALGHRGRLVCGKLAGKPVVAMDGRFHVYEGYPLSAITLPVRVIRQLGAELLVVSNASGGINPQYHSGEIVVIEDHINLLWGSPLAGPSREEPAMRLISMVRPYDSRLVDFALALARREDFVAHRGVYVAMTGPNYETRAEYRFLRKVGGDVVGMSTVPEAIVAAHCGLPVLAISTVTNVAHTETPHSTDAQEVLDSAAIAAPKVAKIVLGVVAGE